MLIAATPMAPILSIVIPTRNRVACAIQCIAVALEATEQSEAVVADSGDDDVLLNAIRDRRLDGERVRYIRTPQSWNVVENFEGALEHCRGDFVLYLGDDDLVGPHVEEICAWAKESHIDALVSYGNRFGVAYYWPGVKSKYFGNGYASRVFIWSHSSKVVRINPRAEIEIAKRNVGRGLCLLPRVYHGLVERELLLRIRRRYGSVFGGVSPDIFSAILVASEARNAVYLDYPFCVPGASPKSEAGSGAARTDRQGFENSSYLKRFRDLVWDDSIPRFFAPYNVWAFSMNEALKRIGQGLDPDSLGRLYARCLLYCWAYRERVYECMKRDMRQNGVATLRHLAVGIVSEVITLGRRVISRFVLPRAGGWASRRAGLDGSLAAYRFLRDRLPRPKLPPFRPNSR